MSARATCATASPSVAYEWHDDAGNWFRSYGNENWELDDSGPVRLRIASINDLPISRREP
jgi:nuclear transport factor 2 (NTF2) superfamily protein